MKIILINPFPKDSQGLNEATIYPPIGLAYLASYLRREGFDDIEIIDANIRRIDNERLLEHLKQANPDIVGIHMNVVLGGSGVELCHLIKKQLPARVFIGGPLVSSNPVEMLTLSGAEAAVIGEAEERFAEICKGVEPASLPGIAFWRGKEIEVTPGAPLIADLDDLPFPAYDLLPPLSLYKGRTRKKPVGVILTSRGCPYRCTYCNSSVFGKKFRARSPENVLSELDLLVKDFGIRQLDILDDNFTLDLLRAEAILDGIIARGYKILINLQNGVRTEMLDEHFIHKLKLAGVFKVGVGIESGDEQVLRSIRKGLSLPKVRESIRMFRREGILTAGFFIIGFPQDTRETIEKTIDFAIAANPTTANFSLLMPFPGTEIYRQMKAAGCLKDPDRLFYNTGFLAAKIQYTSPNLTEKDLLQLWKLAYRKFNFRFRKMVEILFSIRSFAELIWTINAVFPLLRELFGSATDSLL
jgi:anaerobic magnesium-protoporphyrin IX monomethyl ester cyclase